LITPRNKEEIFQDKLRFLDFLGFLNEQARLGLGVDQLTINFAGGEPVLFKHLDEGIDLCKKLGIRTSIISNGLIFQRYDIPRIAAMFDVVGISVDSIDSEKNRKIGRVGKNGVVYDYGSIAHELRNLKKLKPNLFTKINTVVSLNNYEEYLRGFVSFSGVDRWKIFRVLPVGEIENIPQDKFDLFLKLNKGYVGATVEDNIDMLESYVMINSNGQLYQSRKIGSRIKYEYFDLNKAGLFEGLRHVGFDFGKYKKRYTAYSGFKNFELLKRRAG
jgi:radical S-adenosyl methionine domain-containing protein 2